ncbi:uncharacterized protein LOC122020383 isoform X1 [Zingiber officinale]|uniref:uncharacterized protein LOC122020383 isoform X1 n=1 Tax=Zingiber officinale TaxID=94328 RepID=UPI001C4A81B2|nr:uncharacterized protein LOC122020383 isoform X1 [Zingiber officinale]
METLQATPIPFPGAHYFRAIDLPVDGGRGADQLSSAMRALLCFQAAVPSVLCASKANTGTGFGLLGRCRSLSFPRSTGPFIPAPLCSFSGKPPTPPTSPTPPSEDSGSHQDEQGRDPVDEQLQDLEISIKEYNALLALVQKHLDQLHDLEISIKEHNALLVLAQKHLDQKDYEKAEAIRGRIQNREEHGKMNSKPLLLEAVINFTLAVEKLREGENKKSGELKTLIESGKNLWGAYKKWNEDVGLQAPEVEE